MKFERCHIESITESDQRVVTALVRFRSGRKAQLRVSFRPLLEWRLRIDDVRIVELLKDRSISIWVEGSAIVRIDTKSSSLVNPKRPAHNKKSSPVVDSSSCRAVKDLLGKEKSWIYPQEKEILESFKSQVENGETLSGKQRATIKRIKKHVEMRQKPKIYRG